jgi:tetratricopeptide (TPR) repeat protein
MNDQPPPIRWGMPERLPAALRQRLEAEMSELFRHLMPTAITVSSIFSGFSTDVEQRIVLGVELRTESSFQTHIVKLGAKAEIEPDYQGWTSCVLGQNFASRIFLQLAYAEPATDRAAVIYQDGYLLYGKDQPAHPLEQVARWATLDHKPAPESVERVIYQIYNELERWFYVTSDDRDPDPAATFYRARLQNALERWAPLERESAPDQSESVEEQMERRGRTDLRRDVIWILCAHEDYHCDKAPVYLDPYDYIASALAAKPAPSAPSIPATLVGRSHGDLHGRNILVGVQRGEADCPTVFDYGEMGERNVLAWDFAKLEIELKVRILPDLFNIPDARKALLELPGFPHWQADPRDEDVERTLFFYQFDARLADLTESINAEDFAQSLAPLPAQLATSSEPVNRLLRILWRVRKEAALCLGFRRGRQRKWLNELYYCLATYGLCNAKPSWNYEPAQVRCALISSGVAAARLERRTGKVRGQIAAGDCPSTPVASYRVPLGHAHRMWKAGLLHDSLSLLENAHKQFPHAIPLLQEYALVLADVAERDGGAENRTLALDLIRPLRRLCRTFRDHETLSRLGKIYRNQGDTVWTTGKHTHAEFLQAKLGDWQYYKQAQECYEEAFEFSRKVYPGINAATLARIVGDAAMAKTIAAQVIKICVDSMVDQLTDDDRIWLFATEGEAHVLVGAPAKAARLYELALASIHPLRKQMARSMYNQVCRLWWALGEAEIGAVADVFRRWENERGIALADGPFGDCNQQGHRPLF